MTLGHDRDVCYEEVWMFYGYGRSRRFVGPGLREEQNLQIYAQGEKNGCLCSVVVGETDGRAKDGHVALESEHTSRHKATLRQTTGLLAAAP